MKNTEEYTKMRDVSVDAIVQWDAQPRKHFDEEAHKELLRSVADKGVIQPLVLRVTDEEGVYQLVCGECRWRAAKAAGIEFVPAVVRELDDKAAMELAMMENLRRQDLDVLEEADGFYALMKLGFSVNEMAHRFKKGRDFINARLELRKLDEASKEALIDKRVTIQTAVVLSRLDEEQRSEALTRVVHPSHQAEPLSQRQALDLLKRDYIRPNEDRREWEARERMLAKDFPGAKILDYEESLEARDVASGYVRAEDTPAVWEVTPVLRVDMEAVPTWGELAKKYRGQMVVCAPEKRGEDPVLMVEKQPLIEADIAQAKVGKNVFPKPASESDAEEERLEAEKRRQENQATQERQKEQVLALINELRGKELSGLLGRWIDFVRDAYDQNFQDLYNLVHGEDLNAYDDEDALKIRKWLAHVIASDGEKGLVWLVVADAVAEFRGAAGDWVEAAGLDVSAYPDLVKEEGGGDSLSGSYN